MPVTDVRPRRARRLALAAVPLGLVASGAVVYQASFAAFTATTTNPGNTFRSGHVTLTDNKGGTALFDPAADGQLVPGSTGFKCIDVTYGGDVAATVKLSAAFATSGGVPVDGLGPYLDVTVDEVSAASPCAATGNLTGDGALYGTSPVGTLSGLVSAHGSYASGLGTWAPDGAAPQTRRYRIAYTLVDDNNAQSKQAQVQLTWQAQNS